MNAKYKPLFEEIALRSGIQLKNRIVMAPMTNWSSHEDGTVSDAEVNYYVRRSSGAGMVITACTYVTRNGKGFAGEFGADTDDMITSLRRLPPRLRGKERRLFCKFSTVDACVRHSWFPVAMSSVQAMFLRIRTETSYRDR